jgi:general secretion pathway protein A
VAVYEAFFGLSDIPFRLTPDPRYLYLSPKHAEALAHLRAGLIEPGGFVCITGDIGTGKTTLLRAFLAELGPEVATAYVFNPALSADELLRRITRDLEVPLAGQRGVDLMDALNAHLLEQRKSGRLSVVVIDEAQAVPPDVLEQLRLLSNLETSTEKLLKLVLVGQPQLAAVLVDPALAQLNQRITLRWHLGPLTYAETVAYVHHRLDVASGSRGRRLFTRSAVALVHRLSKGVPRLVNMIAHRALLAAYVRRRRRVTAATVLRAYREIRAVPLRRTSPARRAGWATAAALVVALVTVGAPRLGRRMELAMKDAAVQTATAVPAPETAPPVEPAPPIEAARMPAPETSPIGIERRLASADPDRGARTAVDTVLASWHVGPLRPDERFSAERLVAIASERGLDDLHLTGNLTMLRLLDLPALLELRLPGSGDARWVALTGADDTHAVLALDGEPTAIDVAVLDRLWFGEAHVLWRDFEGLGRTFGTEARGDQVARLQRLLARVGLYRGAATGTFDAPTEAAVLDFQRSRLLVPDCRVGRLIRIILYAAAGGYVRPTLGADKGKPS